MPHIHTEPGQHDHTVSAYIFRLDGAEPRLLLHRHKKLGVYLQFGGHIELNETPWQAIAHEIEEESGYSLDQLEVLQPKERITKLTGAVVHPQSIVHVTHQFGKDDHFHIDTDYAFMTFEDPRQSLEGEESQDIKLISRTELQSFPPEGILENVREIGMFIFGTLLQSWEKIPAKSID